MVSLLNVSLLGVLLFVIVCVQAKPLLEASNNNRGSKLPTNKELYDLYKLIRTDPRFASVSNYDIVAYIYRNFVRAYDDEENDDDDVNSDKSINQSYHHRQQQKQQDSSQVA